MNRAQRRAMDQRRRKMAKQIERLKAEKRRREQEKWERFRAQAQAQGAIVDEAVRP